MTLVASPQIPAKFGAGTPLIYVDTPPVEKGDCRARAETRPTEAQFQKGVARREGPEHPELHSHTREFFFDNPLVRAHFIIVMVWWTGLVPWEFATPARERED